MLLSQDERIGLPRKKELHYFDQAELNDINKYAKEFEHVSDKKRIGEITPYYMFHPRAAERINKAMPNTKIIALLRNPVERTISQYFHAKRSGYEDLNLEEALMAEKKRLQGGSRYSHQKHSYLHRSMYEKQLAIYEELFPLENILVIKSEDLFEKTHEVWGRIEKLLALEPTIEEKVLPRANSGRGESKEVEKETREKLRNILNPTYVAIKQKYGISWD